MYKTLNEQTITNNEQNVIEDRTLTSNQLFNKYYYLRRHFRDYVDYVTEELKEQELLILLDKACKGWIKNKIYKRGTPGHRYKTPTFFTKHFKGYVTGYRGNYYKKLESDKEKGLVDPVIYVDTDTIAFLEDQQTRFEYDYDDMLDDYKDWEEI